MDTQVGPFRPWTTGEPGRKASADRPTSRRGVAPGSGIHGSCVFFQTTGGADRDAGVASARAGSGVK
ncbi:hypothetical protein [Thermosporothrix hazakensis]|uniref:hypothetical protein n=1 Tax=Thermosporothrix hazakensis TaxID=644383 RepID=UPI0010F7B6DF|nr:hypothetical protein [Thermosporothrix hazakensis]